MVKEMLRCFLACHQQTALSKRFVNGVQPFDARYIHIHVQELLSEPGKFDIELYWLPLHSDRVSKGRLYLPSNSKNSAEGRLRC